MGRKSVDTATKSGVKFEDLDGDGQPREAGEPGLGRLDDLRGLRRWRSGHRRAFSAILALDGAYTINNINPGTYKVREVAQAGWTNSYPALHYYNETFAGGVAYTGNDFGNWRYGTKSGMKFEDLNGNGVKDAGEPGIADWTIYRYTVGAAVY